ASRRAGTAVARPTDSADPRGAGVVARAGTGVLDARADSRVAIEAADAVRVGGAAGATGGAGRVTGPVVGTPGRRARTANSRMAAALCERCVAAGVGAASVAGGRIDTGSARGIAVDGIAGGIYRRHALSRTAASGAEDAAEPRDTRVVAGAGAG